MISHGYEKSNIPNASGYDSSQASQCIMYWNANNLYGYAMSQPLTYKEFKWESHEEFTAEKILDMKLDTPERIFKVNLG